MQDAENRKRSLELLVKYAKVRPMTQFIILTPTDLSVIDELADELGPDLNVRDLVQIHKLSNARGHGVPRAAAAAGVGPGPRARRSAAAVTDT